MNAPLKPPVPRIPDITDEDYVSPYSGIIAPAMYLLGIVTLGATLWFAPPLIPAFLAGLFGFGCATSIRARHGWTLHLAAASLACAALAVWAWFGFPGPF